MKNSITKHGAEALKIMLDNTSLIGAELDMMKGLVDIMTSDETLLEKTWSGAWDSLPPELFQGIEGHQLIQSGDFTLTKDAGVFKVHYRGESKTISEADVAKKLRELYFRTEEKKEDNLCTKCAKDWFIETCIDCKGGRYHDFEARSCENCGNYTNTECNLDKAMFCKGESGPAFWKPKTKED